MTNKPETVHESPREAFCDALRAIASLQKCWREQGELAPSTQDWGIAVIKALTYYQQCVKKALRG